MKGQDEFLWVCRCGARSDLPEFLDSRRGFSPRLLTVSHVCRGCGETSDVQLWWCEVRVGYTYAAGETHFAPVEVVQAPGLEKTTSDDRIAVSLGGRTWVFAEEENRES
jgi:hypothetical protein